MSPRCLSTLADLAAEGFSGAAQRALSGSARRVPHLLAFSRSDVVTFHQAHVEAFSISGVQVKISLRLHRGRLIPTENSGEFILKPIPAADLARIEEAPANEHLTMQLASQVFGIRTAANGLVRFSDGELAYLTRRFDRTRDGHRIPQEDFAQVLGRSSASHGPAYKYDGSYEAFGNLVRQHVAAHRVELEKLFRRIVFNYVFSNGDAHLKNFSLFRTEQGDYLLTPAYDLMCTRLHLPAESRMALDLFEDYETPSYRAHGFHTGACFRELGKRFGLVETRMERILGAFESSEERAKAVVQRSLLSVDAQTLYCEHFTDRLRALCMS